jgi:hypothetical protein
MYCDVHRRLVDVDEWAEDGVSGGEGRGRRRRNGLLGV